VAETYNNADGVLVVVAGPLVLESVSDVGEPAEPQEEEGDDDVRPGAGE
jgi:hypothetical protein